MSQAELKKRRREDYKFHLDYRTRCLTKAPRSDNDMYSHMNNTIYYFLFDAIVNAYLSTQCALTPSTSPQIGLVVHSHCDYFSPLSFPAVADLGLRVNQLGKASVRYEIGVFERGKVEVRAVGEFVHVFVKREGMKPEASGMGEEIRRGLKALLVVEDGERAKL
ncbi:MAG: hypothetical protein M1819_005084 [Sarea resinae]|nr:MAG: hypothetical protein M1819_005084 [Sarea resinae]